MATVHLLLVDPQNDFCDIGPDRQPPHPLRPSERIAPALPVAGADGDMQRLARWLRETSERIARIHVTLDSHQPFDIAHPTFWRGAHGAHPSPMTLIDPADVQAGRWRTADAARQGRALEYLQALQRAGKQHMIWPEHCIVGGWGHNVHAHVADALSHWSRQHQREVNYVLKGLNPLTEHFSAFESEVTDPTDPRTQYNRGLHDALASADVLLVAGEALSHCVASSVRSLVTRLQPAQIGRIVLLTDCMSSVPGLETLGQAFLYEMTDRGVKRTTTGALALAA